ncbi:MAG: XTP/dITP diphosphatase [Desulfomonile tiedjei]|nr:XTP/dITP diphosphatase [Desulfomonile tiedjei]
MENLPKRILIATSNQGKVEEIRDLVKGLPVEFLSLSDVADIPEVIEDGLTFEENALKKARTFAAATGVVTLADDSGLCIDALDGRPGVHSARYSGEGASDAEKCARILQELENIPEERRTARFVCAMALVTPKGEEQLFGGSCEGRITREPRGTGGFGYDPIFYFEEAGCTFAEMDRESKNKVSHRGRALRAFARFLEEVLRKKSTVA